MDSGAKLIRQLRAFAERVHTCLRTQPTFGLMVDKYSGDAQVLSNWEPSLLGRLELSFEDHDHRPMSHSTRKVEHGYHAETFLLGEAIEGFQ